MDSSIGGVIPGGLLAIAGLALILFRKSIAAGIKRQNDASPQRLVPMVLYTHPVLGLMGSIFMIIGAVILLASLVGSVRF